MTNYSMLPKAYYADNAIATVRFSYGSELTAGSEKPLEFDYLLDAAKLFIPCEELDFTLIALVPASESPSISSQDVNQLAESEHRLTSMIKDTLPSESDFVSEVIKYIPIVSSSKVSPWNQADLTERFSHLQPGASNIFGLIAEAARFRSIFDWIKNRYQGLDPLQQDLIREFFDVQNITPLEVRTKRIGHPVISEAAIERFKSEFGSLKQEVQLKLDIFSGRKNPSSLVKSENAAKLLENLHLVLRKSPLEPNPFTFLGYRGFWITLPVNSTYYVPARLDSASIPSDSETQRLILEVHRLALEDVVEQSKAIPIESVSGIVDSIENELQSRSLEKKKTNCPLCLAPNAPTFLHYSYADNCLAYALNQSGRLDLEDFPEKIGLVGYDCSMIEEAARGEFGLKDCADFSKPLTVDDGWYVAFCFSSTLVDYHWFRQDKHGCWSHMPVSNNPTPQDTDYSENKISDPQTCDRGVYDCFCGFMIAPK